MKKKKQQYFSSVNLKKEKQYSFPQWLFIEKTKACVQKQKVSFTMLALLVPPLASSPCPKGMTNCFPSFTTALINDDCPPITVPEEAFVLG